MRRLFLYGVGGGILRYIPSQGLVRRACVQETCHSPGLAPSDSDAPLVWTLAYLIVTQTAHLIALPLLEHNVTVRAELFIVRDARPADGEKAHHVLL
jgi:hypothetical protein